MNVGYQFTTDLILLSSLVLVGVSYYLRRKLPIQGPGDMGPTEKQGKEASGNEGLKDENSLGLGDIRPGIMVIGMGGIVLSAIMFGYVLQTGNGIFMYGGERYDPINYAQYTYTVYFFPSLDPGDEVHIKGNVTHAIYLPEHRKSTEGGLKTGVIRDTEFRDKNLNNGSFTNAVLENVTFFNVVFSNWSFEDVRFNHCRFRFVAFNNVSFRSVDLSAGNTYLYVEVDKDEPLNVTFVTIGDIVGYIDGRWEGDNIGGEWAVDGEVVGPGADVREAINGGNVTYEVLNIRSIKPYIPSEISFDIVGMETALALTFTSTLILALSLYALDRNGLLTGLGGWTIFGVYWFLYMPHFLEIEDYFNATVCVLAFAFFGYIAYNEWVSFRIGKDHHSLRWLTGSTFIGAFIYFLVDKVPYLSAGLITVVAQQSVWVLNLLGYPSHIGTIDLLGNPLYYRVYPGDINIPVFAKGKNMVNIILACTGIQAMVMYTGAIFALDTRNRWAKFKAFMASVPVIYVVNLFRNAALIWATTEQIWGENTFELAHNWVTKFLALGVLIVITLYVFRILPDLYDNIMGLISLPKRHRAVRIDANGDDGGHGKGP